MVNKQQTSTITKTCMIHNLNIFNKSAVDSDVECLTANLKSNPWNIYLKAFPAKSVQRTLQWR